MEVIVVRRKYDYYEDSYTKILGVCMNESKADELIEIDKHKDDHPKMNKAFWLSHENYCYDCREKLEQNEEHSPKKSGFLNRFNYDGLNKTAKHAYDELKKKYDGTRFTYSIWVDMDELERYYLNQIIDRDLKNISFETYQELDDWYSSREHSEDPEDIYYDKERFEVL
jgi:hypothetical protein